MANLYRPQTSGPLGYRNTIAPPPVTNSPPPSGGGTPAYADYFKYANGISNIGGKEYGSTLGTPLEGTDYSYTEPPNTPDRYKGLLTYNKATEADGNGQQAKQGGYQLNADVIAKLPKTKFGTVDNVQNLDKDGNPQSNFQLVNPNLKYYDPNYGWITPKQNLSEKRTFNDTFADTIMPMIASAAFGQMGMPFFASAGVGAAKTYGDTGNFGKAAMSIAPSLIGAGLGMGGFRLPPEIVQALKYAKYAKTGYDLYRKTRG